MPEIVPPTISGPELVVHLFAPLTGPHAERAYAALHRLWLGCHTIVGMRHPINGAGLANDWPTLTAVRHGGPGLDDVALAGQQADPDVALAGQRADPGVYQALLRRHHDLVNLSVVLAPHPRDPAPGWADLDALWSAVAAPVDAVDTPVRTPAGAPVDTQVGTPAEAPVRAPGAPEQPVLLGSARIYQAHTDLPPTERAAAAGALLPTEGVTPPPAGDPGATTADRTLWEVGPTADTRVDRRLLLLAPLGRNPELSAWTWSDGTPGLPPLARYLLHAATLRHHLRVRIAAGDPLADLDDTIDRELTDPTPGTGRLRRGHLTATTLDRQLRLMADSVAAARAGLRTALGTDAETLLATPGPVAEDDRLAQWFLTYLAADRAGLADSSRHLRTLTRLHPPPPRTARPDPTRRTTRVPTHRATPQNQPRTAEEPPVMTDPRQVFVVHGRDTRFVDAFWDFLRALDLHPREWEEVVGGTRAATPYLGDAVRQGFEQVQAAVVLLTPDDVSYLHPQLRQPHDPEYEARPTGQARPNVLFEAGMAFALYPSRTVLIEAGRLRPFSDVGGRNVVRFDGSVPALHKVAQRLKGAGCTVRDTGTSWLDTRRFEGLTTFDRRP